MNEMLSVEDLHFHYGDIHAVKGVSFHVKQGEIVSLIGVNGAGKTTTLRALSGLLGNVSGGEVKFLGKNIKNLKAHLVTSMGLCHVLEGRHIFPHLTVRENLMLGAYLRKGTKDIKEDLNYIYGLFPRLEERKNQHGGTLSGGEQQMLAIGRGLMSKPKLLIMDEPSLGLAPIIVKEIFETIKKINKEGLTVLLVEQNSKIALNVADRGYVLETGKVVLADKASNLLDNEDVKKSYLGE